VEPLLLSLKELGAEVHVGRLGEKEAVFVEGGGIFGGETSLPGNVSSQFISGLMFACPMAKVDTEIMLTSPLESAGYVKMTEAVLVEHCVRVPAHENHIHIPANQTYMPSDGRVPGDFSSAAFLLAASAITKSKVQITNLNYRSVQGDKAILEILKEMGINGKVCADSVEIEGGGLLNPIEVDAKNIPDLVPAIAAMACYAKGTSHIFGAHRLKLKESDRLESLYLELTKMGARVTVSEDGLIIEGSSPLHGATVDPHNDHRIAMACAVAALGAQGETTIQNAECVRKSYPQFFTHLKQVGANLVGGKFDR
jgi:3-phosphoshikimate 1-carboxyvinyltransferase